MEGGGSVLARRVWTVKRLPISASLAAKQDDLKGFEHLAGVTLPSLTSGRVTLLIGMDSPDAHRAIETRRGKDGEPFAEKTELGWVVRGPLGQATCTRANVNFCKVQDQAISQELRRIWETDFIERKTMPSEVEKMSNASLSVQDKFALNQMENSLRVADNGHYEMDLAWKENTGALPESKFMAEKRLNSLKKKFEASQDFKQKYTDTMEGYIKEGHASQVKGEETTEQSWYIPHHGVLHPQKPDKLRVVFDCAARAGRAQISLNDCLLQGPDFITSLIGVLLRFRQERVALQADIKQMFHQVFVSERHRSVLRFLWWRGGDCSLPPSVYQMNVFLFGAKCSPSCACFAFKRAALDQKSEFSEAAVNTVLKNFYVDDMLKSTATEQEAQELRKELKQMLQNRGFELTKWISNSEKLLATIPEDDREKSVKTFEIGEVLPEGSTLGVKWNIENDAFCYKVNVKDGVNTRRQILSVVASLYDPLGFMSPVTLQAKQILQELCEEGVGWDDPVSSPVLSKWEYWAKTLPLIQSIEIPRCMKGSAPLVQADLHVFSDASEKGYGACAYVVGKDVNNSVHVSLVMGKSRVAPSKIQTLPRLELTAAVLGAQVGKLIKSELEMKIEQTWYWTDSAIVLGYLNNKKKRFKTFVANRIATIHECTSIEQWRHVPGKQNPADLASRGFEAGDKDSFKVWFNGPDFLATGEVPQSKVLPVVSEDDPEVKREACFVGFTTITGVQSLVNYFSDWHKLKRAVCWFLRFKCYMMEKV